MYGYDSVIKKNQTLAKPKDVGAIPFFFYKCGSYTKFEEGWNYFRELSLLLVLLVFYVFCLSI